MQLKQNASLKFLAAQPADKVILGRAVITALGATTAFPNIPYTIRELEEVNENLSATTAAARTGSKVDIEKRDVAEKLWNNDFRLTAKYVNQVANNDTDVLVKSGFPLTKATSSPKAKPAEIEKFTLSTDGLINAVNVSVKVDRNTTAYLTLALPTDATFKQADSQIEITIGDVKLYATVNTQNTVTLNNLPTDAKLKVAVMPVNNTGAGNITAPKNITIQGN